MIKYFLAFLFLFSCISGICQFSEIKGKVESRYAKEKLIAASVTCTNAYGKTYETVTDQDGEFKIKNVVPGIYDIRVDYVGFEIFHISINVQTDKKTELKVLLEGHGRDLSKVEVYGKISQEEEAGARQKEKHSSNIVNIISAQAMERSPDINAANVLQRMSGLTIQRNGGSDEAYPIIRGTGSQV